MEAKKDCFAYNETYGKCNALKELYCIGGKCNFYKNCNEVDKNEIARAIKIYTLNHS